MKWTDKQAEAIDTREKNLLVAAAAGSGKTAVLVERIKQLILKDGCSIDKMLVVTFTNAAAAEMKGKIEKAIRDEINDLSVLDSGENRARIALLKNQLDLLPMANISTFHSFAMEVVRKFFYVIGCEPNFKICDEARKAILMSKAMDELLEKRYEEEDPAFFSFLDKYAGDRNDFKVRTMIDQLRERLEALPYPWEWLEEKTEKLDLKEGDLRSSGLMEDILSDAEEVIRRQVGILERSCSTLKRKGLTKGLDLAVSDLNHIYALEDALGKESYETIRKILDDFNLDKMNKAYFEEKGNPGVSPTVLSEMKSYIDKRRKAVKGAVSGLRKELFSEPESAVAGDIRATLEDVRYLGSLVREYDEIFAGLKKDKGLMDFSDMEHFAFNILLNDEAAGYYREKFRYIFVDEYQDSNVLQEALIGRIAGENNLFTVGDVKQSIYKFRLAEPEIFRSRYMKYKKEQAEKGSESLSAKIDLNRNFRSKDGIIDFINEIFTETMEDYGEDEALYAGDPASDKLSRSPELVLVNEDWEDSEDIDDAIKELKKTEKEALLCVKLIRDHLGETIYDSKDEKERPLRKRDIVILMRSVKDRGDIFYKVLMENNIPCFVDDNKGYFDTIEINTFMSLIKIIDNHRQDIPLLTVLRSEMLDFSVKELAEIRLRHKEGSYYDALLCMAQGEDDPLVPGLSAKCREALDKIREWQEMAKVMPLEELVWKLMLDTGFYASMGAMPGGAQRQANLRLLADKALDYRKNQNAGLYGFINYVDHIKDKDIKMSQARVVSEDEDTVRIMTIHHSKGLEFPMVIIAGYTRMPAKTKGGSGLLTDKDLGIALPVVDPEHRWYRNTLLQELIKRKTLRDEIREEKRVLYVAMTRAKDILIMTGTLRDADEAVEEIREALPRDSSYFNMTGGIISRKPGRIRIVDDKELARVSGVRKRSIRRALQIMDQEPGVPDQETERIMNFVYPYEQETRVKSKYSVSELNSRNHKDTMVFDPSVPRLPEKNGLSAVHVGTVTHSVLEKMDFRGIGSSEREEGLRKLQDLIDRMVREEYLTPEEGEAVDQEKLYEFAACDLGRRIGRAQSLGKLYRERSFNLKMEVDGEEALVQGIIDCFFEEEGKLVLVDYKTTAPRNVPGVRERYQIQMDIYRDALVKAMGMEVAESYLYLTNMGLTVDM